MVGEVGGRRQEDIRSSSGKPGPACRYLRHCGGLCRLDLRQAGSPYTEALIAAAPVSDPTRDRLEAPVEGKVPSSINTPSGCAFHPCYPLAVERCRIEVPPLVPVADGRVVACSVRAPATDIPVQAAVAVNSSLSRVV